MTLGDKVPGFWHHRWVETGKVNVSRDTQVFKEGPAALRVSSTSDFTKGQTYQLLQGSSGQSFVLSGFVKSKGTVNVNVAVQSFSQKLRPIQFQTVQNLHNSQDWTAFSQDITLPPNTHQFGIALFLEGQGQAWLDEVKLAGRDVKNIAGNPSELPPPKKQDPTVPMHGYFPKYPQAWLKLHQKHLKRAHKRKKVNMVFLGDSITQGWQKHKKLWQKHYKGAVNFGIGGDRTQQVLWRIEQGLFDQIQPKLVVLNIGVNNLWGDKYGAARISAGIEKIVEAIQAKSPQTKILIIGILPTGKKPNTPIRRKIQAINTRSETLDNGNTIRFLDIGSEFLQADGQIPRKIMPDYLHLSRKGYQIWADSMQKHVDQMLAE
ncbi:GDSL-type esterase/lipase family protein [Acaryochloris sp. IP29b_bin.148]|uniref:GDSL-type esterase/lipase family protein n=1 Tax=Acaryochloris sp. IP29b_bin.148 TaxID=2969218 RepID=UPI0026384643|nr:GDSL-type esterase/lipase family protein [Acaryochloris sp. IP29b_bin.148]